GIPFMRRWDSRVRHRLAILDASAAFPPGQAFGFTGRIFESACLTLSLHGRLKSAPRPLRRHDLCRIHCRTAGTCRDGPAKRLLGGNRSSLALYPMCSRTSWVAVRERATLASSRTVLPPSYLILRAA